MRMMWMAVALLMTAVPIGAEQQRTFDRSALQQQIETLHTEMIAAFRQKPESVAGFYTADARIIGGGRQFTGDAIRSYWGSVPPGASWTLELIDFGGSSDEAWVLGRSTLQRDGGMRMVTDYVAVLKRVDGRLRYHIDMFTAASRP